MLDYKRSHTRDITTLTWYCKTSTSYKEYTWVQNTIHVTLYTHHVHDIVRNCDKPGNEGQLIFDFFWKIRVNQGCVINPRRKSLYVLLILYLYLWNIFLDFGRVRWFGGPPIYFFWNFFDGKIFLVH